MSTKDKIMRAAKKLFCEKGYHATSLKDLAKEIGTTTSIIYYYFNSKEELLVRIYELELEESIDGLLKIAHSKIPTTKKMADIIKYCAKYNMEKQSWAKIFFEEESALPSNFQKLIQNKKRQYNKVFEDIYSDGVKEGVFKPTPNLRVIVNSILGMYIWAYKWYRPDRGDDPEKIAQQMADILLEGYTISKRKYLDQEQEVTSPGTEMETLSSPDRKIEEVLDKIQTLTSMTESLAEKLDVIRS
ncbi:MAG: TetR/AcrR family transcriptional regulator [Thermodesulfobacteriota bacterium]